MAVDALAAYVQTEGQTECTPIYGKRGEDLPTDTLRQLLVRLSDVKPPSIDKNLQAMRWWILRDRLKPAAKAKLEKQYDSPLVRAGVESNLTSALNPAADIVARVCQVYRHGVRRHVVGLNKTKTKAFQQLYREAGISSLGVDWNKIGYFCGPTFAVPQVRAGKMRVDTLVPHKREIVLDEDNPTGWPVAIAYKTAGGAIAVIECHQANEYRLDGEEIVKVAGKGGPRSAAANDATPFPGLRFDAPLDPDDWDNATKHERLTDTTIDVSAIGAVMGFVRQTQNRILLFLSGQLDKLPKKQAFGDPQAPLLLPTDPSRQVSLEAVVFDTPVDSFLAHIRFWYAAAAESTGVPAMISQDGGRIDLEFAYDGLSELRDEQIVYADAFETEFAVALICAAEDGHHPLWETGKLPSVEEVRKGFRAEYGQMARRFADPQQQRDQADWDVRHGLISIADLLAKRYPQIDRDELMKQIKSTLEENALLWDMLAARNVGADASGKAITGAQQNGAKGPEQRDKGKVSDDAANDPA